MEHRAGRAPGVLARVPARPAAAVVPRGVDLGGDGDAVVAVVPAHVGVHVEFAAAARVGALECYERAPHPTSQYTSGATVEE